MCMLYLGNGNTRNVYVLNNVNLNIVDSVKDLGFIVTSDLSCLMNVVEVVKKANKISNAILHMLSVVSILIFTCVILLAMYHHSIM